MSCCTPALSQHSQYDFNIKRLWVGPDAYSTSSRAAVIHSESNQLTKPTFSHHTSIRIQNTHSTDPSASMDMQPPRTPPSCSVCGAGHTDTFADLPQPARDKLLKCQRVSPCKAFQQGNSLRLEMRLRKLLGI
jgi:hypothetical protein